MAVAPPGRRRLNPLSAVRQTEIWPEQTVCAQNARRRRKLFWTASSVLERALHSSEFEHPRPVDQRHTTAPCTHPVGFVDADLPAPPRMFSRRVCAYVYTLRGSRVFFPMCAHKPPRSSARIHYAVARTGRPQQAASVPDTRCKAIDYTCGLIHHGKGAGS